jgi:hypothetical protein
VCDEDPRLAKAILVALPEPKEIANLRYFSQLPDERWAVLLPQCVDHGLKLLASLLDEGDARVEDGPFLRDLGKILVDIGRNIVVVRTGWEGIKGGSKVGGLVHAVLLDTFALLQPLPFLARHLGILLLKEFLEPKTIVPSSPDFVVGIPGSS